MTLRVEMTSVEGHGVEEDQGRDRVAEPLDHDAERGQKQMRTSGPQEPRGRLAQAGHDDVVGCQAMASEPESTAGASATGERMSRHLMAQFARSTKATQQTNGSHRTSAASKALRISAQLKLRRARPRISVVSRKARKTVQVLRFTSAPPKRPLPGAPGSATPATRPRPGARAPSTRWARTRPSE